MPIKIPLKKSLSNKSETPVKTPAPAPFIDKLCVVISISNVDGVKPTHGNLWSQLGDKEVFKNARRTGGEYNLWRRIALDSLADSTKWPLLQYAHADGMAKKLRIEFVPVDLGADGLLDLHSVLTTIVPDGWAYFIKHGRITRIDVSVDFPDRTMSEFLCLPSGGLTTTRYSRDGQLETYYLGNARGNQTLIYSREKKRKAQKKAWQGVTGIRVERRLQGTTSSLKTLADLKNPFAPLALVSTAPPAPPGGKAYLWSLFQYAVEAKGLASALAMLPETQRSKFRAHYKQYSLPWWDTKAVWKKWPDHLSETRISDLHAWL